MFNYVSPEKVLTALRWLKANNSLYADIDINEEWLGQAMANDDNLFAGMVEPSDANNMNDSDTGADPGGSWGAADLPPPPLLRLNTQRVYR